MLRIVRRHTSSMVMAFASQSWITTRISRGAGQITRPCAFESFPQR